MSSKATTESNKAVNQPKKIALGNVVVVISLMVLAFIYHKFSTVKDSALNQDYYRVLYEASNKLNISLNQLKSSVNKNANFNAIRAILPSYRDNGSKCLSKKFEYKLAHDQVVVFCKANAGDEKSNADSNNSKSIKTDNSKTDSIPRTEYAYLSLTSIMPATTQGFSQYLLVNADKKVLSSVGKDKRISIVDIASIQEAIAKNKAQSRWNFSKEKTKNNEQNQALPNMSTDIDLTLSSGDFRVFMFPFKVNIGIFDQAGALADNQHLYLVGLLPKQKLAINGTGYWDLTLLVVTIACVLFCWVILRLFMLPKNHVVSRTHRYSIQLISYFLFIVLVALLLANMQKAILQSDKDQQAIDYLTAIDSKLAKEINAAFSTLEKYRGFYHNVYSNLKNANINLPDVCQTKDKCQDNVGDKDESLTYKLPSDLVDKALGIDKILINQSAALKDEDNEIKQNINIDELSIILHKLNKNAKGGAKAASFYKDNLAVSIEPFQSHLNLPDPRVFPDLPVLPNGLLSIFTVNSEGITSMPSISFSEINNLPTADNLSHRAYYQLVRDQQGSTIAFKKDNDSPDSDKKSRYKNVHIQRLLNVADGTLGTTISMPMCNINECTTTDTNELKSYVLGADVLFKSLSLAKPSTLDFTYMIINRNDGDVLFHSNEDRSMVENIFYSSHETSNVEHWIKAGLDNSLDVSLAAIKGFYHGKEGRFFINASTFDKWSIVIFYPDDSLDTLMTNEFLYIVICFSLIMLFIVCFLFSVNYIIYNFNLPIRNNNPILQRLKLLLDKLNTYPELKKIKKSKLKKWAKVFSIYIACGYMLFFLLNQVYLLCTDSELGIYHVFYAVVISEVLIVFFHALKYKIKENRRLWQVLLLICMTHIIYFHITALLPIKSLNAYYHNYQCSQTNLELTELNKIALMLYPNTVTQHNVTPDKLIKIEDLERCEGYSSEVTPDDLPSLSSLEGTRYFWRWAQMYLFYQQVDGGMKPESTKGQVVAISGFIIFKYILLFALLVVAWEYFQRKVLIGRVYCQEDFLKYIQSIVAAKLTNSQSSNSRPTISPKLEIDMNRPQTQGINVDWLISINRANFDDNETLKYFPKLYSLSPCLQELKANRKQLKNLCISITRDKECGLLNIYLCEIETCLNYRNSRLALLTLITDLKTLVDTQLLASFTVVVGFNSLQKVEMKALLPEVNVDINQNIEYISWSECLKDFSVKVPVELTLSVNKSVLDEELEYFPELSYLKNQVAQNTDVEASDKPHWATLHYIHLCSEALFRFKWELCSNEEKLALYHLAKGNRLNPMNNIVIEHLAINGLIKVDNDHLKIINQSFAEFVLNAESQTTLNMIVKSADQGPWRNYKLPLTLMIFLGIAAIALTSGESLFIIFGSLAAMATTLAGFANSANLIKGQMK